MAERRIALTKKVSLAALSEGWDDCYAIVRPATYGDYQDFIAKDVDKMTATEQLKLEMDFVNEHFISGKLQVFNDNDEAELKDMLPEDVEASTELANLLFFEILGVKPDPKVSSTATVKS